MRTGFIIAGVAILIAALAVWRVESVSARILETRYAVPAEPLAASAAGADVTNGERLAHLNGCFGCHGAALTGRVAFSGIFGSRLTAPNLTRLVREQSDAQLARAVRYGAKPDGTTLIGMPAGKLIKSSDSDIAAILGYLHSLPRKPDATPPTRWRFDGRVMLAMGLFPPEAALVDPKARGPRATPAEAPALGEYVARSQCAICHGRDLSGDPNVHSPDLRVVAPRYTLAAFQRFLKTGEGRPGHDTRIMAQTVKSRLRYLTPAETAALYTYLRTPVPKPRN